MFDNKVVRDTLCFHERNHMQSGDYNIDWATGLKHVKPHRHLAVNEGGMIFLTYNTPREPDMRDDLRRQFGVDIRPIAELPPLFAPQSDRKVTKRSLLGTMYLVDERHERVLCIDRYEEIQNVRVYARWITVTSPAAVYNPLKTKERNLAREKRWKEDHVDELLMAKGILALDDGPRQGTAEDYIAAYKQWNSHHKPADMHDGLYAMAKLNAYHQEKYVEMIVDLTADYNDYPHLTLKPFAL